MNKASLWSNSDGLVVGFGTRSVEQTASSKVSLGGQRQQIVMNVKLSDLADTLDTNDLVNAPVIPAGAVLESAKLFVVDAAVGATAVLDLGIAKAVDSTDIDDDGIDVAIATATLTDGAVIACDGAKIGTELAYASKVYASYDTAAFTGGNIVVTIEYLVPAV